MDQIHESLTKNLSLAINLVDNFTKEPPVGKISVALLDEKYKAVKNPSRYYLFLNLPAKEYTIQIRSDFYVDQNSLVKISPIDPEAGIDEKIGQIIKDVILEPTPAYPFPKGATLIRGMVLNHKEKPVPYAKVTMTEKGLSTLTTEKGEYVFYFQKFTSADILTKDGKRYVKPKKTSKNTTTLTIKAEAQNSSSAELTIDALEEGTCLPVPTIKLYTTS
jgi:hypothetical protein